MTRTSFLVLAGATALTVLAATGTALLDRSAPALAETGNPLVPGLEKASAETAKVTLHEGDFEAVFERRDGTFVDAVSGYPVDPRELQELVGALALAEIAEAKTTDPARHADLGLAAPDAETGGGTEILLQNEAGDAIAHVIAGKRDTTLGGISGGQYVRRAGEDATWLARARIDPPARRSGWFETRLFETEEDRIVSATLQPEDGDAITFSRTDDAFTLEATLPDGKSPSDNQIARIPRLFATLDFTDVRADDPALEPGARLSAEIDDGQAIVLEAVALPDSDDRTWVRILVEGDGEAAGDLRAQVEEFLFELSSGDGQILGWTLDDLTEDTAS